MSRTLQAAPRILCLVFFIPISGCSPWLRIFPASDQGSDAARIDSLIVFKEAIASGNYLRAVDGLDKEDQRPILTAAGKVKEEYKPRLSSVRLGNLIADPQVRLRRGGLAGITSALPMPARSTPLCTEQDFEIVGAPEDARSRDSIRNLVHAAAVLFFEDIRSGVWQFALNDLHAATRSLLQGRNGKIHEAAKIRLRAIDTTRWRCLALREGKLIGVMALVPPPEEGLEDAYFAFLKSIRGGEWAAAMDMLTDGDREHLTRPMGRINPDYAERLRTLEGKDWDVFSLREGRLSGIVAWLGEDSNPTGP
ncbi:MAG TPA: hypothetical protein VJ385_14220 [Fibrobacteria bacterium]|nr:hypothetical protein [Fibrobacteria bacterium]